MKYSMKKLCITDKIKRSVEKKVFTCKGCLHNILGELQGNCAKCFYFFFYKNNNNGSKTGRTQNPNKMYAKSAQNVCKCP